MSISVAATYTNEQYDFSVDLPPGMPTYTDAGPTDNHGVIVYLGYNDGCTQGGGG